MEFYDTEKQTQVYIIYDTSDIYPFISCYTRVPLF